MFSYYGSKSKVVHLYPKPKFDKIIEPFAGSARYSLKYFDRDVLLVDKYEVIVGVWKYLQQCSPLDIMKLPDLKRGDTIRREDFDCIEQAWLMGFMVQWNVASPRLTVSRFVDTEDIVRFKKQISSQLYKIKHWKIQQGSYEDIPNQEATWFVDPPYQVNGGSEYRHNSKGIDYSHLAEWCKSRDGHVVACESIEATWLPFYELRNMPGIKVGDRTAEAIWSNMPHNFMARQPELFPAA